MMVVKRGTSQRFNPKVTISQFPDLAVYGFVRMLCCVLFIRKAKDHNKIRIENPGFFQATEMLAFLLVYYCIGLLRVASELVLRVARVYVRLPKKRGTVSISHLLSKTLGSMSQAHEVILWKASLSCKPFRNNQPVMGMVTQLPRK